jgi:hypothetical protein
LHFLINLVLKISEKRLKAFEYDSMNFQFFYTKQMMVVVEMVHYELHLHIIENHFHVVLNNHLLVYFDYFFLVIFLNIHYIYYEY